MERKIIQIASNDIYGVVALCDDHSVWRLDLLKPEGWVKLPDIPQE